MDVGLLLPCYRKGLCVKFVAPTCEQVHNWKADCSANNQPPLVQLTCSMPQQGQSCSSISNAYVDTYKLYQRAADTHKPAQLLLQFRASNTPPKPLSTFAASCRQAFYITTPSELNIVHTCVEHLLSTLAGSFLAPCVHQFYSLAHHRKHDG